MQQEVFFLPACLGLLCVFLFNRKARLKQPILKRSAIYVVYCLLLIFSLNLLTIDLRNIGDRFHAQGPRSLKLAQITTAYTATLGMGAGGFLVGAPYAAMENLRLLRPNPGEITLIDNFPAKSKKVARAISIAKAAGVGATIYPLTWVSYCQDSCDIGYALNGGSLAVDVQAGGCVAIASVNVAYKPEYRRSTLIEAPLLKLRIDQAALHAVQQLGYLHPYTLHYKWQC